MKDLFKNGLYLMDGGLETTLVYHEGIVLNHFAAFELIENDQGREILKNYYEQYLKIAKEFKLDFILEAPTWRANPDWVQKLGYPPDKIYQINKDAIQFMREIALENCVDQKKIIISGCIGPRGDGYNIDQKMSITNSYMYHRVQISSFAMADSDMISALTMNYSEEAIGIALVAKEVSIPVVISFTVETDGKLPSGESIGDVISKVDRVTNQYPEHYMINCAHPEHFKSKLKGETKWKYRIKGIRANASTKSHAELDASESLDIGDIEDLALNYKELKQYLPNLKAFGGCCGTDHRHIHSICHTLFE